MTGSPQGPARCVFRKIRTLVGGGGNWLSSTRRRSNPTRWVSVRFRKWTLFLYNFKSNLSSVRFCIFVLTIFERFPAARWLTFSPSASTFLSSTRAVSYARKKLIGRNFSCRSAHIGHTHSASEHTIDARTPLHYAHGRKRWWSFYLVFDITRVLLLRAAGACPVTLRAISVAHIVFT